MLSPLRRLVSLALVMTLAVAAAPSSGVRYTDTQLQNGLRVIISEDHAAPVFSIVVQFLTSARATSARAAPASRTSSST